MASGAHNESEASRLARRISHHAAQYFMAKGEILAAAQ